MLKNFLLSLFLMAATAPALAAEKGDKPLFSGDAASANTPNFPGENEAKKGDKPLFLPASRPSPAELQRKLADLQARIDRLQAQSAARRGAVMRQIEVDADKHSQFLSDVPFFSGYDPEVGFVVQSDDGNFSFHPSVLMQFRDVTDYRSRINPGQGGVTGKQGDDTQNGFEMTRLRLTLDGNLFSQLLTYYVQLADDASMSQMTLLDAYAMYRIGLQSPLAIKVGQFKDPVWHEQNILPSQLMAADRSLASALVGGSTLDRVQGAAIIYDQDRLRGQLVVHDGYDGGNTPFYSSSGLGSAVSAAAGLLPTNWGASGRVEYLAIGDREPDFNPFAEYDHFTARGDSQTIFVPGGGVDFSESGANNIIFHTIDGQFSTDSGWSLYAAYLGVYRELKTNRGVAPGSYYDTGVLIQAAYMVNPSLEAFIRYDYTHLDGRADPGIGQDNLDEITIGANYYLFAKEAKITLDGTWLPNGCPTDVNYLDILENNGHNEFILRAQFQLQI